MGPPLSRSVVGLCVAIGLLLKPSSAGIPPTAEPDAVGTLREAMRTLAAERAGFTAFHLHLDSEQRAPGHDASLDVQSARLRSGDRVVAVRLYRQVANGKPASADELARLQGFADRNLPNDDYRLPVTPAALSDYRFENVACAACPAGQLAIRFTSVKRDDDHGDGTVVIDSSHHFVRIEFAPSIFPKHVDSATVTITFGRVLPDLWDVVETQQRYSGHMLFIHGGADVTTTYANYRRFNTLDEGLRALASGV